ncbi:MAG: CDP-alcohol phosphatidyltransferase family protein [Candidatus Berkiella sp.]
MLENYLRPVFSRYFVDGIVKHLAVSASLRPQQVTFIAGLSGIGACIALMNQSPLLACGLLLFSGYCDILDGALARKTGCVSSGGAVLDIAMDRIVEFAVILGIYWQEPETRGFLCILMLGSILCCVTSFLVVGIFSANDNLNRFHYSKGLVERFEAFVFFTLMILFPDQFRLLGAVFVILVSLTTLIRITEFLRQLPEPEQNNEF